MEHIDQQDMFALRREALDQAISAVTRFGFPPGEVIPMAYTFLKFLKGEEISGCESSK